MLRDAHVHLADARLHASLPAIKESYDAIDLCQAIVVGTEPNDWFGVIHIAKNDSRFLPAIGLHPWKSQEAPQGWKKEFEDCLDQGVRIIGEIGLDQWIDHHDIDTQLEAFRWQFRHAARQNLPTTIHCLKAHEPLLQTLRKVELPKRGFALHAYNGPTDTIDTLLEMGAYFSINGGQLKPNAKRVRSLIRAVPDDRLLIETDAPDFLPPPEQQVYTLQNKQETGAATLNHPGNLRAGYEAIAQERGCSMAALTKCVAENFSRYFLEN